MFLLTPLEPLISAARSFSMESHFYRKDKLNFLAFIYKVIISKIFIQINTSGVDYYYEVVTGNAMCQ